MGKIVGNATTGKTKEADIETQPLEGPVSPLKTGDALGKNPFSKPEMKTKGKRTGLNNGKNRATSDVGEADIATQPLEEAITSSKPGNNVQNGNSEEKPKPGTSKQLSTSVQNVGTATPGNTKEAEIE